MRYFTGNILVWVSECHDVVFKVKAYEYIVIYK